MKINVEQLPQRLRSSIQPGFWLASDEVFLQQISADLIRQHAKQSGFSERIVFHIDAQFNWHELFQQLNNHSLFNDKQLVELHFLQDKLNDQQRKALQQCISQLHEDMFLLILSHKIDTQAQKAKWFTEIIQTIDFIPIWPISAQQYSTFIKNRSQHYQLTLEVPALQLLCENTQGNPWAADQVLQQLQLLFDQKPITREHLADMMEQTMQTDLFAFVDVFLAAKTATTLTHLQLLKNQQVEPILIIWALARELRTLNNVLLQLAQGQSLQQAFNTYFIWPSRQNIIAQACKLFSQKKIYALMAQLATIDLQIKGIERGSPWLTLERLVLC